MTTNHYDDTSNNHQNGSNLPQMCQIGGGRAAVAAGGARDMICLEPLVRFFFFFDHTNVYFFNRYLDLYLFEEFCADRDNPL